jgi:antitoxin component YwqK of YwqJK toxin-antitoxin module
MIRINDKDVDKVLEFMDVDNAGGPVYNYKKKPFTGIIESFYENGNLMDEVEFTNGHIGGVLRKYFENGQMKTEYHKYYGKPEGDWKTWDDQGNLIRHSIWKEGEKTETIL